jgi:hypothetical protein
MIGYDGKFNGDEGLTRAQAALAVYRCLNYHAEK